MYQEVKEELCVRLDRIDAGICEEFVEVVVHARCVLCCHNGELATRDARLFLDLDRFVVLRNPPVWIDPAPENLVRTRIRIIETIERVVVLSSEQILTFQQHL